MGETATKPVSRKPIHRQASRKGIIRIPETTADILDGFKNVSDWDDEELRRGRRRDKNGKFAGRDPVVIPMIVHRELIKRTLRKAEATLTTNLETAVAALVGIANSPAAEDRDRLTAVKLIMDRVMGKVPDKLEVGGGDTPLFVAILQGGIVPGDILLPEDDGIIDVESTEITWEG